MESHCDVKGPFLKNIPAKKLTSAQHEGEGQCSKMTGNYLLPKIFCGFFVSPVALGKSFATYAFSPVSIR